MGELITGTVADITNLQDSVLPQFLIDEYVKLPRIRRRRFRVEGELRYPGGCSWVIESEYRTVKGSLPCHTLNKWRIRRHGRENRTRSLTKEELSQPGP